MRTLWKLLLVIHRIITLPPCFTIALKLILAQLGVACEGAYQVCFDAVNCRLACYDGVKTRRFV